MKSLIKLALSNRTRTKVWAQAASIFFKNNIAYASDSNSHAVSDNNGQITMDCRDCRIPAEIVKAALLINKHITIENNKINGIPFENISVDEFPEIDTSLFDAIGKESIVEPFRFDSKVFKNLLLAAAKNDIRYYLNGICFDFKGKNIVATDGHRLHAYNSDSLPAIDADSITMSRDAIELALLSKADTIEIYKYLDFVYISTSGPEGKILSKPIDGKFPNYNRVMPVKDNDSFHVRINNNSFLKALKLIKVASTEAKNMACELNPGTGTVSTASGFNQIFSRFNIDNRNFGKIGFNYLYLIDVVNCLDSKGMSEWYFRDDNSPVLVTENNFKAVVMPMRL